MNQRPRAKRYAGAMIALFALPFAPVSASAVVVTTAKQQSLEQWRHLTSPTAETPRVFVKGNRIRFYFQSGTNVTGFDAGWSHVRVPTDGYAVSSGRRDKPTVIAGAA